MDNPPDLKLYQRLYNEALKLRGESERMLFLAVFAALGVIISAGVGFVCKLTALPFALIIGTILSSFLLIPLFLLIGTVLWDKLNAKRATSGNEFDILKYLKDEYDRDVREINSLPFSEADKKRYIKEKYEKYENERYLLKKRISSLKDGRRSRYYLEE